MSVKEKNNFCLRKRRACSSCNGGRNKMKSTEFKKGNQKLETAKYNVQT